VSSKMADGLFGRDTSVCFFSIGDRRTSSITSRFRSGFIRPYRFRAKSPNTGFFSESGWPGSDQRPVA
jgi:hypothetical protein